MKNKWKFITPISFVLFVASLFFIKDSNVIIALVASVTLHEFSHAAVLKTLGVPFNIIFIPLLGAGVIPSNFNKYMSLPKSMLTLVAFAGPILNTLLLLVGLFLVGTNTLVGFGQELVRINTIMIVVNIAPVGPFDGYKIANNISQSLKTGWLKLVTGAYYVLIGLAGLLCFWSSTEKSSLVTVLICLAIALLFSSITFFTATKDKLSEPMSQPLAVGYFAAFVLISIPSLIWIFQTWL